MFFRRIGILLVALGVSLGAMSPAVAQSPTPDPDLDQVVEADELVGNALTEVSRGHVDIGPRIVDGTWTMMVRDDTASPPIWRHSQDLVMRVSDTALMTVPDDPQFSFLELPADRSVHVIPQTQNQQAIWLGWNTQDPSVVEKLPRGAELVLQDVTGPGEVYLFLSNGFDAPTQLWDSTKLDDGAEQKIWIEANTHVHANWVFTEPGAYRVDAELRTAEGNPEQFQATAPLLFAVGEEIATKEVAALVVGSSGAPTSSAAVTPTTSPAESDGVPVSHEPETSVSWLWIGVGAAGLIAVLGLGAWLVMRRGSRLADSAGQEPKGKEQA